VALACTLQLGMGPPARAEVFLTREQALAEAFGGAPAEASQIYLTEEQVAAIEKQARSRVETRIWTRYSAVREGRLLGHAYFDTHVVRTMPETILVVLGPRGDSVQQVLILAFAEPDDYRPRPRWLATLEGRGLDAELWPGRGVPRISGATLTTQAITDAVRRVLALHAVTGEEGKEP
jgi:hypothetical protein